MEIQESRYWQSSTHFSDGRTRFTSSYSMLQTVTSPNLLSRDACYTLGVLKPCYTVEKELAVSKTSTNSTQSQVTAIHASKVKINLFIIK